MSLLFLLASLGVINGVLVGSYLILRKNRSITDFLFGSLILSLCIRIGKSVFFYFNRDADKLILQLGLSACIFIGPLFYLYIKSIGNRSNELSIKDKSLLFSILFVIIIVGVAFPYRANPDIWNGFIIYGIYSCWIFFGGLGIYRSIDLIRFPGTWKGDRQYLLAITISFLFITVMYQSALFFGITYIWGSLIFTVSFYYLLFRAFISQKPLVPKIASKPLENADLILEKVNDLMKNSKPYLNQGLKLEELALEVGVSKHQLSQVLNEEYPHGFARYVQEYRVEEAKQLIKTRTELSLEGIGFEAGFSSKSSFFDAFKKIADSTPAAFKKTIESK